MEKEYPPEKILLILKNSKLFSQFDDVQLISLINFSRVEHFERGTTILQESTHNENIYLIIEGSVAVYVDDELIMQLRRVGDIIGEMSVITNSLTTASVVADTDTSLFSIPSKKIYDSNRPDIRSIWFKVLSDILADKLVMTNKRLMGYQATSEELNNKKHELVKKTMILQSVMGSMSDGVVVTNDKGEVIHVNDAFIKMVGDIELPSHYHLWPKSIGFFKPDENRFYSASELSVESLEICVKNPNLKEEIWLNATSSTLKTEDGINLGGTVTVFRDYTRKKHEELALIKAKENAEATAKAKSDFLSVMSHELRNPLNAIIGVSDILQNTSITSEQNQYLATITRSSRELLDKIRNILDFNHLESGDVKLQNISYSLARLIEDTVRQYSGVARDKNIALKTDIGNLNKMVTGKADEEDSDKIYNKLFMGDPERIGQILGHLIQNAIKFSSGGEVRLSVFESGIPQKEEAITLSQKEPEVPEEKLDRVAKEKIDGATKNKIKNITILGFEISDQGIGLSEDQISSLFQPFFQADSSYSRKFEGTGLGLAICRRLVELMGGEIRVESEQGRGSRFIFNIVQSVCENSSIQESFHLSEHKRLKILVAEDNKVNQMLIKKILTRLGYSPLVVENGLKAVQACKNKQFDVILMDIQMPEMDGLEASQKILEQSGKSGMISGNENKISAHGEPLETVTEAIGDTIDSEYYVPVIIALTANITEGTREECMAAGMTHYMSKPLNIEQLTDILNQIEHRTDS